MAGADGRARRRTRSRGSTTSCSRRHALERDGADAETIVCALLHDIGDIIGTANHSQVAAALLRPYVSEKNWWVVHHHGLFQGYYYFGYYGMDPNARDLLRDHPFYDETVRFCAEWDQNCFDPAYPTEPLAHFEPLVREIFARPPADMFAIDQRA